VPWGISEAAFAALDAQRVYQYKAFGVPALGLKRGLEDELVVAPYATVMALQVEPMLAMQNLQRLEKMGLRGDYGFYESIDFSRQRLRDDDPNTPESNSRGAIVRCFMVHHQGMSLVALNNVLNGGAMQNRFHADPYVQAAEPLLHERIPSAPPVVDEVLSERPPARLALDSPSGIVLDRFASPDTPLPRVHLLSNGEYSLMVTNAGGGYSRWKEWEITRWRADSTRDNWGTFFYVKDVESGVAWSAAHQPLRRARVRPMCFSPPTKPSSYAAMPISKRAWKCSCRPKTMWKSGASRSPIVRTARAVSNSPATPNSLSRRTTPTARIRPSTSCSSRPKPCPKRKRCWRGVARVRLKTSRCGPRILWCARHDLSKKARSSRRWIRVLWSLMWMHCPKPMRLRNRACSMKLTARAFWGAATRRRILSH
jgi:hypothetical protein